MKKTFLILIVLLCLVSFAIASASAASDIASNDTAQSSIDNDNAINEVISQDETINEQSYDSISQIETDSLSNAETEIDGSDEKSSEVSPLKDGGTTIYVSTTGDDSHDGSSEENAVATVSKAYELAGDGSTIQMGVGNYTVNGIAISKNINIKANEAGTVILDGDKTKMFTVASAATLSLVNLDLTNGGTSGGGFVTLGADCTLNLINSTVRDLKATSSSGTISVGSNGKVNIEGSHFENINSSSGSAILAATSGTPAISIKDSSFNNIIQNSTDFTLMKISGNLILERSNFTNIVGTYRSAWYGAIGTENPSNFLISECQFINITGGDGSAIYFGSSKGNLTVNKSIFVNNRNFRGSIYLSSFNSAKINYNIFINNVANVTSNAKDVFISSGSNINASYNFWNNNQPSSKEITNVTKAPYWTVLDLSTSIDTAFLGNDYLVDLKFMATDGSEIFALDESMPEYSFDLSASLGSIVPSEVAVTNNEASATYTPETAGSETIVANPCSIELPLNVMDPDALLVVSTAGNDVTGEGTLEKPFATIAHALSQVTETRNLIYLLKTENKYKEHDLTVSGNVTIKGEDQSVMIDGENLGRIFTVSGIASIEDLTLQNGKTDDVGGAIYVNGGNLTLSHSRIGSSNAANGGAIGTSAGSTLTVSDSEFISNEATNNGGAIYVDSTGDVSISSSRFMGNDALLGEAIYIKGASLCLSQNTMASDETIYLESGNVKTILTFISNRTIIAELGETLDLTASLTDDNGNAIRGGTVTFTANGETIGSPVAVGDTITTSYTVPTSGGDIVISGSYSFDNGGTVKNGIIHPAIPYWFIEGKRGYETLNQAIDAAESGDVIYGKAGTYTVNLIKISKDLTIKANDTGTIVLDGGKSRIFTVESTASLTLVNLTLRNGGSSAGGLIRLDGPNTLNIINSTLRDVICGDTGGAISTIATAIINIEGSRFENISSYMASIYALNAKSIIIKDSSFNNIVNTGWDFALIQVGGNLTIERSNFTNVKGKYDSTCHGAIGAFSAASANYVITESQFINVTGGEGSAIYFDGGGNLTVSKSLFMNNKNYKGSIYVKNPNSAKINYNLFIDNVPGDTNAKDVYIVSGENIDASYNFWGSNTQPSSQEITNVDKAPYWTIVELSSIGDTAYVGAGYNIDLKFMATDGTNIFSLDGVMPDYAFDLSASSGTIDSTVTISNNEGSARFTPSQEGTVTITAVPGPAELVLNVEDSSALIVVSTAGSDTAGTGTMENPYATISKALSQVTETRNVIYLLKTENDYKEHGIIIDKNVTIMGEDKTVAIDGENLESIFFIGLANVNIQGLTLINGEDTIGGAILNAGNLTLNQVNISNCVATLTGGGAICTGPGSSLTVLNSVFEGNNAVDGGAIYIENALYASFTSNKFSSNAVTGKGEAFYVIGTNVSLSDNTMTPDEIIYIESGGINSVLTFLSNSTVNADFSSTILINATLTDDKGNAIRGGLVNFTVNYRIVGQVDLSGDAALRISFTLPYTAESDILVSGSYSFDNGGTVKTGAIHPPIPNWFIEGKGGYEFLNQAVEAAQSGDVISGRPGNYTLNGIIISKDLTIKANETGSIVLDGDMYRMFIMNSTSTLTLVNLTLRNGGTSEGGFICLDSPGTLNVINCTLKDIKSSRPGGAIYLTYASVVNIEGSHFENFSSTDDNAVLYTPSNDVSVIIIRDSSFNNINTTKGSVFVIHGNLTVERSNFTNIKCYAVDAYNGVLALAGFQNNAFISECQFMNLEGGTGSAIYILGGNLTVRKSVFMNNKNQVGTINMQNVTSAKINYNLFINNTGFNPSYTNDVFIQYISDVNADFNFWGNNSKPTTSQIRFVENATYWTVLELSSFDKHIFSGEPVDIHVKFLGTDGIANFTLDENMPEFIFRLRASSGNLNASAVNVVNNSVHVTYTPSRTGTATINATPGSEVLEFDVMDASKVIVVSSAFGNDQTGEGTMDNPYATIAHALSQVTETRNIVYLLRGPDYHEYGLTIAGNVTIKGEDRESVVIDARFKGRIFNVTGSLSLEDLSLESANLLDSVGGAIIVDGGNLSLNNVGLYLNNAVSGGAIAVVNGGSLNVTSCIFEDNEATNGSDIYIDTDGDVSISSSAFNGNRGAEANAIYIKTADVTLSGNTIKANDTIYVESGSVNAILTFIEGKTIKVGYGEIITLNATITDDNGNAIRGGNIIFTANGEAIGDPVPLSDLIQVTYTAPMASEDIVISGSYSFGNGGTLVNGTLHSAVYYWFIEGKDKFETLKQALDEAVDDDVIYGLPGTYNVSEVTVRANVTIKANESGSIILNGNGNQILVIRADVVLENMTFINGSQTKDGGLIRVDKGSLVINNSVFKDSQATSGKGSAIYVYSGIYNITIENSVFDNIKAYDALINCRSSSTLITVSKTNFTNIDSVKNGVFYFYEGGILLSESQFINITGLEGAAVYVWGKNDNVITKCLFDNVTTTGNNGIIYSNGKTIDVNHNIFLNVNKGLYSSSASNPITASYNWWGTNDPRSLADSNTVMSNWIIMTVNPQVVVCDFGETIEIAIDFKHTNNTAGVIGDFTGSLLKELTVLAASDNNTLSPAEQITEGLQAKVTFVPELPGVSTANIASGSQTVPVVITAKKPTVLIADEDVTVEFGSGSLDVILAYNGHPVEGKLITVKINDEISLDGTTNAKGIAVIDLSTVPIGTYSNVLIKFEEDGAYYGSNVTSAIVVTESKTSLSAPEEINATVGSGSFNVTLTANGVPLEGKLIAVKLTDDISLSGTTGADGVAVIDLSSVPVGTYNAVISFAGDSQYNASSASSAISVKSIATDLSAEREINVNAGSGSFNVTLTADGVPLEGKLIAVKLSDDINLSGTTGADGVAVIDLSSVPIGSYNAVISFAGETPYEASSTDAKISVREAPKTSEELQRLIDETPAGGTLNLSNVEFTDVSGINITKDIAIVGDNALIATAGDGTPVFNIASDLNNVSIKGVKFAAKDGVVLVKATAVNGTDDLSIVNPAIEISNVTVSKASDDVVASSITLFELESERAVLAPSNSIVIKDNALAEGIKEFDFKISGLNNGSGIDIPQGGNINTNGTAPIVKIATAITGSNIKTTTVTTAINGKNAGKNFTITLKDSSGNVLADKEVVISFNGKVYKVKTNAKGIASVKVALSKKGTYPVVVTFLGDEKYNGSYVVRKIVVNPQKVKLTVAKKKFKARKKTKVLTAKLTASNKKAIKGKKLIFIINKKKYTAKTNKKGIAKVKVKLSKRKTYKLTVKFAGDNTFKKVSKKSKVVVK